MTAVDDTYRTGIYTAVSQIADLIAPIEDFAAPGLGAWDLGGLVGHFTRAIRTPLSYLMQPEPTGPSLLGAAAYIAAYLDARDADAVAMDERVAVRGAEELAAADAHPSEVLRREASRLDATLSRTPLDRRVASPFGPVLLGEYLRTRGLEIAVHGLDIARAVRKEWAPPDTLLTDAIALLGEVAVCRGVATDLLLALTGRTPPDPADVVPILR